MLDKKDVDIIIYIFFILVLDKLKTTHYNHICI